MCRLSGSCCAPLSLDHNFLDSTLRPPACFQNDSCPPRSKRRACCGQPGLCHFSQRFNPVLPPPPPHTQLLPRNLGGASEPRPVARVWSDILAARAAASDAAAAAASAASRRASDASSACTCACAAGAARPVSSCGSGYASDDACVDVIDVGGCGGCGKGEPAMMAAEAVAESLAAIRVAA